MAVRTKFKPKGSASVSVQHRVAKVKIPSGRVTNPSGVRGPITAWSEASRRRFREGLNAVDPAIFGEAMAVVTLTYPGLVDGRDTWRDFAPSGEVCHRHLREFKWRWRNRFGQFPSWVWKLEYQGRGAPHFMVVVKLPDEGLTALRGWVAQAWYEVVGSGQASHLLAGTQVAMARKPSAMAWYISGYLMGEGRSKEHQHVIPADFEAGRWWGIDPSLKAAATAVEVPGGAAYRVKRVASGIRRARKRSRSWKRWPSSRGGSTLLIRGDVELMRRQLGQVLGHEELLA